MSFVKTKTIQQVAEEMLLQKKRAEGAIGGIQMPPLPGPPSLPSFGQLVGRADWYEPAPCEHEEALTAAPEGLIATAQCPKCRYAFLFPLGELDPRESRCTHRFTFNRMRGTCGTIDCINCTLSISILDLQSNNIDHQQRYSHEGNTLADEAQRLRDENTRLLAEVGRLTLQAQTLERKQKAGR